MIDPLSIRPATPDDRPLLRHAIAELQDYERGQHATRLPGQRIADDYLAWMLRKADATGAVLVAEIGERFAGFVAGWVEEAENIGETPDSNRFGLISDVFVLPEFRGRRIAARLIQEMERQLKQTGIRRLRVNALAVNASARRSYEHAGFAPYEVIYEKQVGDE